MSEIYVEVREVCSQTRKGDGLPYSDGGETHTEHNVIGIKLAGKKSYDVEKVPFDVQYGVPYFLVYAVYSTGDSFSHDQDAGFEFIGLYETTEEADEMAEKVESTRKTGGFIGDGFDTPWGGYFEDLSFVEVKTVYLLK